MNHASKRKLKLKDLLPGRFRKKRIRRLKQAVAQLYEEGRHRDSADLAIKSAKSYPRTAAFHHRAGMALACLGRDEDACKHFSEVLAIVPNHLGASSALMEVIAGSEHASRLAVTFSDVLAKAWSLTPDPVAMHDMLNALAPEDLDRAAQICRGYYLSTGNSPEIVIGQIRTIRDWAAHARAPLIEAGEVEKIPFKAPVVFGTPLATDLAFGDSNKPYVAEIAGGRAFSHSSLVLAPNGTILSDDAGHAQFGGLVSFKYEKKLVLRARDRMLLDLTRYRTRDIDAAVFLAGSASGNFGHWLPDFLPRIQFFRQHPDFSKLPIIVDADMPHSHFEHLRKMAGNDLILLQSDESLVCGRLLVASAPGFMPVHLTVGLAPQDVPGLSLRALRFLQSELSSGVAARPFRKIYLARANMQWRRLTNEEEVIAALASAGFETVYLERMSAADQVRTFEEAAFIVGPNGSALLNMIFADRAAKVLIFSQSNLFNWGTLQGPMEALGYQPLFVCGEEAKDASYRHSDYRISPGLVMEALRSQGLATS